MAQSVKCMHIKRLGEGPILERGRRMPWGSVASQSSQISELSGSAINSVTNYKVESD